jgi:hypothetical protein
MTRFDTRIAAGLIPLFVLAAAASSPARLEAQGNAADPARRPVPAAAVVRQPNGRQLVPHNGAWLVLPDWLTIDPVGADDLEDDVAAEDESGWRARVSDAGFDRSLYGGASDEAAARQQLAALLQQAVDDLSQKQKLQLAGRGDIKRLFDRIEESRRGIQAHVIHDVAGMQALCLELSRALTPLRKSLKTGPLGEGSLFARTLNRALTADQIAAREKWKREHPVAVTYSWDLRVQ